MKLTSRLIGSAVVLVLGLSLNAWAGIIHDSDSDLVPDVFDNCSDRPNGPHDPLNQTDDDADGFGTACDCDFTQDNFVLGDDFVSLFAAFNTRAPRFTTLTATDSSSAATFSIAWAPASSGRAPVGPLNGPDVVFQLRGLQHSTP